MSVSVIIPVYQAEKYIGATIDSVLRQKEVIEVILVEDNSPDNSIQICRQYENQNAQVRLITHPDHQNLGAAASRNLGIEKAIGKYIAFLDSDDLYLPNRFQTAVNILENSEHIDGVHELMGVKYENEAGKRKYLDRFDQEITGMKSAIAPELLFSTLARGKEGYILLGALTMKAESLKPGFRFDTNLFHCSDSDFILRLSKFKRLCAGNLSSPVGLRRIHNHNRVFEKENTLACRRLHGKKIIEHNFYGEDNLRVKIHLLMKVISSYPFFQVVKKKFPFAKRIVAFFSIFIYLVVRPSLLKKVFVGK
jgi:glycosyltransferase involved in cell wall biosynthesis